MSFKLIKSTLTVGTMTTVSRVFGLLRDILFLRFFSVQELDNFIIAFRIPNFFRSFFAEGGFVQAALPLLAEYKETRSQADLEKLINQLAAVLSLTLFILVVIGIFLSPWLIIIFAPGLNADDRALSSDLLRITLPYIWFISLTAFASAILNNYQKFAIPAFTPVLLNLSLIICTLYLAPMMAVPITALAWGVFIGGVVQLLFQLPALHNIGMLPKPKFNSDRQGLKRLLTLMLPIFFISLVHYINIFIDTLLASFLVKGSITWLYFSSRLVEFPLGVFGIALTTVIFPLLSKQYAQGSSNFQETLVWALRLVFFISLPAAAGLIALAVPLITTLFQYGSFTFNDVVMTSYSLIAYVVSLPAVILIKIFSASFFSTQDTKTPLKIGIIVLVFNLIFSLLLIQLLAHAGLALATSCAFWLQALLLYLRLKRKNIYRVQQRLLPFISKLLIAATAMGGLIFLGAGEPMVWFDFGFKERTLNLTLWLTVGVAVYFMLTYLLRIRFNNIVKFDKLGD